MSLTTALGAYNSKMVLTVIFVYLSNLDRHDKQPRSQGLSSYRPLGRARRDPGLVFSRATMTIENIREGSSIIRQFVVLSFVALQPPLPAMFYSSLWAQSSNSIYSTIYVKVRQVCLKTIYRGPDFVVTH